MSKYNSQNKKSKILVKDIGSLKRKWRTNKWRGRNLPPQEKSGVSTIRKLKQIIKQVEKLEFADSEEEIELKEKLKELLV